MNVAVYLPLLASLVVGVIAPLLARVAQPAAGAIALASLACVAAVGSVWAVLLLAGTLWDDLPHVAGFDGPVPDAVGMIALTALAAVAIRTFRVHSRRQRLHRHLRAAVAGLDASTDRVVVVADPAPEAFAIPGQRRHGGGRIIISDSMLRALDADQQCALLAHENAHLDARHHWLRAAADYAVALNPLLRGVRPAVAFLCERWADERAAVALGDRDLIAHAVAAAALAGAGTRHDGVSEALAFGGLGVLARVAALREPAPPTNLRIVAACASVAGLAIVVADAHATEEFAALARVLIER